MVEVVMFDRNILVPVSPNEYISTSFVFLESSSLLFEDLGLCHRGKGLGTQSQKAFLL